MSECSQMLNIEAERMNKCNTPYTKQELYIRPPHHTHRRNRLQAAYLVYYRNAIQYLSNYPNH
ncbi:hypothetical protein K469DRAFT_721148 [Zopfia rhizophila CBS 207.26]|uniref:Uncharacterized protein n=1 Tax=Zopfia rhizophila CBS 207.26 TaxID=1314779 RepID=A0A6A6DFG5_9PEZI|nr:hypothetical protein K469DRAFT_721148 [Zopfia rhizophila CBS 207.26]